VPRSDVLAPFSQKSEASYVAQFAARCFAFSPSLPYSSRPFSASAQNAGNVRGTLTDPSGAVVPNAVVHLINDVSGFDQTATTNAQGQFVFSNVPFNPYRISTVVNGFAPLNQNVEIRSACGRQRKAGSPGYGRQLHSDR